MSSEWVTVPREPTPEMREAAASYGGRGGYSAQRGEEAVEAWHDMLAAAPPAPAAAAEPVAFVYGTRIQWTDHGRNIRLPAGSPVYAAPPPVAKAAEPVAWALIYSDGTTEPYMGKDCPSLNATPGIRARPLVWGDAAPPPVEASQQQDWPECSGDPMSCPENEGYGCCKPNRPASQQQQSALGITAGTNSRTTSEWCESYACEKLGGVLQEQRCLQSDGDPCFCWRAADVSTSQPVRNSDELPAVGASVVSYTDDLIRHLREVPNFSAGKLAHRAAAELSRLTAEAEALRKDAERYRWLRENWTRLTCTPTEKGPGLQLNRGNWASFPSESVDAAIDAAIAAQQGEKP